MSHYIPSAMILPTHFACLFAMKSLYILFCTHNPTSANFEIWHLIASDKLLMTILNSWSSEANPFRSHESQPANMRKIHLFPHLVLSDNWFSSMPAQYPQLSDISLAPNLQDMILLKAFLNLNIAHPLVPPFLFWRSSPQRNLINQLNCET